MSTYTCLSQAIAAYQGAGFSVGSCALSLAPYFTGGNGCLSGIPAPAPAVTLGFDGGDLYQYVSGGYCSGAYSTILIEPDGRITYINGSDDGNHSTSVSSTSRWATQVFGDEQFQITARAVLQERNGAFPATSIVGNYNFLFSWSGPTGTSFQYSSSWLPIGNYVQMSSVVSGIGRGVDESASAFIFGTISLRRSSKPSTVISTNYYVSADGSCPV